MHAFNVFMTTLSRRQVHQRCTGGEITGERPHASFGILGGRRDWNDDQGWEYCLDAPTLMAAGSVLPVNIPVHLGGLGYEGNVSSIVERA